MIRILPLLVCKKFGPVNSNKRVLYELKKKQWYYKSSLTKKDLLKIYGK